MIYNYSIIPSPQINSTRIAQDEVARQSYKHQRTLANLRALARSL